MLKPIQRLVFNRKISLGIFNSWRKNCECPKPIEPERDNTKYVVEKSCAPCIFHSWKPKVPDLKELCRNQFITTTKCSAAMRPPEKTSCDIKAEAEKCLKMNHPLWLKHCPPRKKNQIDGPLPVLRAAFKECRESKGKVEKKSQLKSLRRKCRPQIPAADWNHDGIL